MSKDNIKKFLTDNGLDNEGLVFLKSNADNLKFLNRFGKVVYFRY
ncbi:hypothetical protein [Clostridium sp. VAP52]|nr:hypothetical protein [Clostridium sp. VAP52]